MDDNEEFENEVEKRLKKKESLFDIAMDREALIGTGKAIGRGTQTCSFCVINNHRCINCVFSEYFRRACIEIIDLADEEFLEEESGLFCMGVLQFLRDSEDGKYPEVTEHLKGILHDPYE